MENDMKNLIDTYTIENLHEAIKYAAMNDDLEINISKEDIVKLKCALLDAIQEVIGSFIEENDFAQ
jgi:hypothetical protein